MPKSVFFFKQEKTVEINKGYLYYKWGQIECIWYDISNIVTQISILGLEDSD